MQISKSIILFLLLIIEINSRTSSSRSSSSSGSSLPDHYRETCTCNVPDSSENFCKHYQCTKESYTKSASCFPKTAKINILNPDQNNFYQKNINELEIGDNIMAFDLINNEIIIDEVIGFLHKEIGINANFVQLQTKDQLLTISSDHIIFIKNDSKIQEIMAKELIIGNTILIYDNEIIKEDIIVNIRNINDDDLYAPLTRSGTLIVDNIVVSCYTSFKYQNIAHNSFIPYRLITSLIPGKYLDYQIDNINWYAFLLMKISENMPFDFNFKLQNQ